MKGRNTVVITLNNDTVSASISACGSQAFAAFSMDSDTSSGIGWANFREFIVKSGTVNHLDTTY